MSAASGTAPEVTIVAGDVGPIGGMERQLSALITGLLRDGYLVTVVSWTCGLPAHDRLRWIRVPGPSRPFAIAYPWFILAASLLIRFRGRGIVHSTGAIVLNRCAVSTVHFCHHAAADLDGISRTSRDGPLYRVHARIVAAMKRLAERVCYSPSRTRRLVAVSNGVADELRRHFPKMRDRVMVIPNGVDISVFHPPTEPGEDSAGDGLEAIFVGSEWERKGLRIAIEALDGLPEVRLTVVGEGDVDSYRQLTGTLGVDERVHFVGATDDVAPWYRDAGVFLLPTSYEAAPLVTYEAAASGLPLLVTKVNGVEDLLREGVNGWFIEREPGDVRERLRALQEDPSLIAEMGEAAHRDALEFSWSHVVERYRDLYASACDS